MLLQCFRRIMGAGGCEAAFGAKYGRDDPLINFYQYDEWKAEYQRGSFPDFFDDRFSVHLISAVFELLDLPTLLPMKNQAFPWKCR